MQGLKTGGRQAGTPNKITSELREMLKGVIDQELQQLCDTLAQLPARDRLELTIKLLPYCMPKVETIGGQYDTEYDTGWTL